MKKKVLLSLSEEVLEKLDKKVESIKNGASRSGYIETLLEKNLKEADIHGEPNIP